MTGEPSLVSGAAALLESALRYNGDELPRLYLTGALFMALTYCGSNLVDIAQLFRVGLARLIRASPILNVPSGGINCSQYLTERVFAPMCLPDTCKQRRGA